jgi:hypothetical protein
VYILCTSKLFVKNDFEEHVLWHISRNHIIVSYERNVHTTVGADIPLVSANTHHGRGTAIVMD